MEIKAFPSISVIMGVNQNTAFLKEAINSILQQSHKEFEFLIIANNCEDGLISVLEQFKDPRIHLFRTAIGQLSFNLNFALNQSQGDLIVRMDSDDIAHPDRIKIQLQHFLENKSLVVLGTSCEHIDQEGKVIKVEVRPKTNLEIRSQIYYKNPICHPSVMFRKSEILKVGGYLGGRVSEDYSLWLRLIRNNEIIFKNLEEPLLKYRIHAEQSRGDRLGYAEAAGLVLTEFLLRPSLGRLMGFLISSFKIFKAKKCE